MNRIVSLTGTVPALGDSTGVGDPIVEEVQRKLGETFQGYHFTQSSKQKLMEGLAVAIQSRTVWFPDGVIAQELKEFEFEFTRTGVRYSCPPGYYDDCVCALALATRHLGGRGYEFRFQRAFGDLAGVAVDGNTPDAALAGNNAEAGEFVRIRRGWEDRGGLV